jgi:hypothetical protein
MYWIRRSLHSSRNEVVPVGASPVDGWANQVLVNVKESSLSGICMDPKNAEMGSCCLNLSPHLNVALFIVDLHLVAGRQGAKEVDFGISRFMLQDVHSFFVTLIVAVGLPSSTGRCGAKCFLRGPGNDMDS